MQIAWAFVKRDLLTAASYRTAFVTQLAGVIFQVALFFFIAQVFGSAISPSLATYGGDYFAFVLVGVAFSDYLTLSLTAFSSSVRDGQSTGTLELMLLSPRRLSTLLLASTLWSYIFTTFRVTLYLVFGVALFGLRLGSVNVPAAFVVLFLSMVCFGSLGIVSASFTLVIKKGDPIIWAFGSLSSLLGGVYFPVDVLPDWLRVFAQFVPLTYALEAMRQALLVGSSFETLLPSLAILGLFSVAALALGIVSFRAAIRQAKIDGSLAHF